MALREVITLTPAKPADYQALFLTFFVAAPLQYLLLAIRSYGLFAIMIPAYCIPADPRLQRDSR
jgi:phosphatidate cytidylyltransferase